MNDGGADDDGPSGACGAYVAAVADRMAFTPDERETWQPLIESAYLAGWHTAVAVAARPPSPRDHADGQGT